MQRLDLNFSAPAAQLAADEALLDWCEAGHGGEMLVFWEPRETFVVVGYANKVAAEVNAAACAARGVPIFRRCSGGGAVVQMPGGLNYSLILRITESGPTRNISTANQFIMERNRGAVQAALSRQPLVVSVRGHTDLAVAARSAGGSRASSPPCPLAVPSTRRRAARAPVHDPNARPPSVKAFPEPRSLAPIHIGAAGTGTVPVPVPRTGGETPPEPAARDGRATVAPPTFLKVAGNSQRRRKQFLLFHGTLLLNCDLRLISELLPMPSLQPEYRARRSHGEFVANLLLPAAAVKAVLVQAWNVDGELTNPPLDEIDKLAREKYATHQWNYKF